MIKKLLIHKIITPSIQKFWPKYEAGHVKLPVMSWDNQALATDVAQHKWNRRKLNDV